MIEFSYLGLLVLLIYLPIFLLSFKKEFQLRFSKINSLKKLDLILEGIAQFIFLIISI